MIYVVILLDCLHLLYVAADTYNAVCPTEDNTLPEPLHNVKSLYAEECAVYSNNAGSASFTFNKDRYSCSLYTENLPKIYDGVCNQKENTKYFNRQFYSECSKGWYSHANKCFYLSNYILSWENAKQRCLELGGHLATIRDNATNAILLGIMDPALSYWLGGNDLHEEGTWIWDFYHEPLKFTFWARGEPNNLEGQQHCLRFMYSDIDKAMKWFDRKCGLKRLFICEMQLV